MFFIVHLTGEVIKDNNDDDLHHYLLLNDNDLHYFK